PLTDEGTSYVRNGNSVSPDPPPVRTYRRTRPPLRGRRHAARPGAPRYPGRGRGGGAAPVAGLDAAALRLPGAVGRRRARSPGAVPTARPGHRPGAAGRGGGGGAHAGRPAPARPAGALLRP